MLSTCHAICIFPAISLLVAWTTRFKNGYHWRAAKLAVGRDDLTFHDLRHSAASELINQGVDLYTAGAVLGHRSAASTKRYAHLATDRLAEAIKKMGKRA